MLIPASYPALHVHMVGVVCHPTAALQGFQETDCALSVFSTLPWILLLPPSAPGTETSQKREQVMVSPGGVFSLHQLLDLQRAAAFFGFLT